MAPGFKEVFLKQNGTGGWRVPAVNESCCMRPALGDLLDEVGAQVHTSTHPIRVHSFNDSRLPALYTDPGGLACGALCKLPVPSGCRRIPVWKCANQGIQSLCMLPQGPDALYIRKGVQLAAEIQAAGSIITAQDLRSAEPVMDEAISAQVLATACRRLHSSHLPLILGLAQGMRSVKAARGHGQSAMPTSCVWLQAWGLNFIGPPPPSGAAAVLAAVLILAAYQVTLHPPVVRVNPYRYYDTQMFHEGRLLQCLSCFCMCRLADAQRHGRWRGKQPDQVPGPDPAGLRRQVARPSPGGGRTLLSACVQGRQHACGFCE